MDLSAIIGEAFYDKFRSDSVLSLFWTVRLTSAFNSIFGKIFAVLLTVKMIQRTQLRDTFWNLLKGTAEEKGKSEIRETDSGLDQLFRAVVRFRSWVASGQSTRFKASNLQHEESRFIPPF